MSSLGEHLSSLNPPRLPAYRKSYQASWCLSYLEGIPGDVKAQNGEPKSYLVLHQGSEVCSGCAEKKQKNRETGVEQV